ncbi:MAG: hypothetical protein MUP15_08940, partial [Dehalococcoidia bacterium]|nr:hypothetical protein [Dehalococcoidia bacterium]
MATAYTPGLAIVERCRVRRQRHLPLDGDVLVKVGDRVDGDQVIARSELPGDVEMVNVSHRLGCLPAEVEERMLKKAGEEVEEGEVIARSSSLFGLYKNECQAPVTGTIETVSKVTGQVLIRKPPMPIELTAYVPGEVTQVLEGRGAVVEAEAAMVQGIFGIGGETLGEILVAVNGPDMPLQASQLGDGAAGKVVLGGKSANLAALKRAQEVGVSALVVGGIEAADLEEFMGRAIGVAITGSEDVGLTLVVTEGFGDIEMSARTFELLAAREGQRASVNGATQIRAGVIRPEVIIPVQTTVGPGVGAVAAGAAGLKVGDAVRIIREPFFGVLGRAFELPSELVSIETEAKVRTIVVELENG